MSLRPILDSHWWGDDWPNSQTPYWNEWRYGESSLSRVFESAQVVIEGWIRDQGRFYPVATLEYMLLFNYFPDLKTYKLVQFIVTLLTFLCAMWFAYLISRSHKLTILFGFVLAVVIQFRRDFDPHLGFAMLVPSMTLKLLLSAILLMYAVQSVRRSSFMSLLCGGCLLYFAAMSTYEHAFVLLGLPVISILRGWLDAQNRRRAVIALAALLFTWGCYATLVFGVLRSRAGGVIPRYEFLWTDQSIWIALSQLFAAFPLVIFNSGYDFRNNSAIVIALIASIALLILLMWSLARAQLRNQVLTAKLSREYLVTIVALNLIAIPGLLLAIRPKSFEASRINSFQPQLTYLHVFITQIGTALLLGVVGLRILSYLYHKHRKRQVQLIAILYVAILFMTVTHNYAVARDTRNRELNYESWMAIHDDATLFEEMRSGDLVISNSHNFAYETNTGNFYHMSGIRLAGIAYLSYLFSNDEIQCMVDETCKITNLRERIRGQLSNGLVADSREPSHIQEYGTPEAGDWVWQNLQGNRVDRMRLWMFELYPITSGTFVAYTAPLQTDSLYLNPRDIRFVSLSKVSSDGSYESHKPSLAGTCLTEIPSRTTVTSNANYPLRLTFWQFPETRSNQVNYLRLTFGIC